MLKRRGIIAAGIVVLLALVVAVVLSFSAGRRVEAQTGGAKKWETKVVRGYSVVESLQAVVNKQGEDGWELVQVIEYRENQSPAYIAFLKRPRQ